MDSIEFLGARCDNEEQTVTGLKDMVRSLTEINDRRAPDTRHATHVYDAAAWALDRMLTDIAAKRAILAAYVQAKADFDQAAPHAREISAFEGGILTGHMVGLREAVHMLAAHYEAHPDYAEVVAAEAERLEAAITDEDLEASYSAHDALAAAQDGEDHAFHQAMRGLRRDDGGDQ